MRSGINAAREPAGDYQAAIGQIPCQTFCHLIPVGGRTTRAYDPNLVAIQKFNISANIEQRRWIINFVQTLRVLRLVPGEQAEFRPVPGLIPWQRESPAQRPQASDAIPAR